MTPRRVAVTGIGVVCSLGVGVARFRAGLRAGAPGIGVIRQVNPDLLKYKNVAEATDFRPEEHIPERDIPLLDRFAQFAAAAAVEAVENAAGTRRENGGIPPGIRRDRAIIVTGTSAGGQSTIDEQSVELYARNNPRLNPFTIPRTMSNSPASYLSMKYGLTGPAWAVSTACSSSNHAIGQAFWMVRQGLADFALTGGSEAPLNLGFLKAWEAMRVVSPDTCRPFSKDRKGLILGEGAGFLVLEPLDAATARGATVYAEIAGFGMTSDAYHVTQPSPDGAAAAMRLAIENAGLMTERIGYINAHGTGTQINDPTETKAIHSVFGHHAKKLAVSSTKSLHGHILGGAGAVEAVATVLALKEGWLPPTANFGESDPACDLDVIPNRMREIRVEAALSNSFAFGGLNAVLAFKSPDAP